MPKEPDRDPVDPVALALAEAAALPCAHLVAVFERYAHPLADAEPVLDPVVVLADGARLGRLSYRSPVDVIANDHFVLIADDNEPLALPGPLFAAAVAALTRKAATRRE